MIQGYVPVAQIIGILLDSMFLDLLDYDATNMSHINNVYEQLSEASRAQ